MTVMVAPERTIVALNTRGAVTWSMLIASAVPVASSPSAVVFAAS